MSDDPSSNSGRDLLSRLNALKKSTVSFDQTNFQAPLQTAPLESIDPAPARALHADLLTRWKSLGGNASTDVDPSTFAAEKPDDEKTVEELLADLGPSEAWAVDKSEEDQVADLLRSAKSALAGVAREQNVQNEDQEPNARDAAATARLPAIDVSAFQPGAESDDEADDAERHRKDAKLDEEADELLAQILHQVKHEPAGQEETGARDAESDTVASAETQSSHFDLPAVPSRLPESVAPGIQHDDDDDDDALTSRLAGLSLPSVPTSIKSVNPTKPSAKPGAQFPDEEIDTWCIICSDDATLQCIGCDGDLYCMNCWVEGHRGEDAGMEERTHKAVQYVKGGGKKKHANRRVMMGA